MATIFNKIIKGEIPSFKIFENEYVYAFLDINPIQLGHTLIVPKIEVDYFVDVPEPYYSEVFKAAKIIAPAIQKISKADRIGCLVEGFEVPHFHYHLIPIFKSEKTFSKMRSEVEMEMLAKTAKAISKEIE